MLSRLSQPPVSGPKPRLTDKLLRRESDNGDISRSNEGVVHVSWHICNF